MLATISFVGNDNGAITVVAVTIDSADVQKLIIIVKCEMRKNKK